MPTESKTDATEAINLRTTPEIKRVLLAQCERQNTNQRRIVEAALIADWTRRGIWPPVSR